MAAPPPLALEPYATMRAEIDAGEDLRAVIDREKVAEATWTAAQAYWLKHMATEAETRRFETTTRYQALYVAKKKIFEGKRARKKAKEEQPKLVEPNVAALDAAASVLAARGDVTIPAIVVPKPPVVDAAAFDGRGAAPSFELPPPLARPPAPRIAEPARVGPMAAASALPDRTAPMQTAAAPAASLPFAAPSPNAPPPIVRPAIIAPVDPAPASGRTANVDIDKLIRERKGGATPFPLPANKFESTVSVDLRALAAGAATPFAPSAPAGKGPASTPPPRRDSTPFGKAVAPAQPGPAGPLEADDDDAPKTMMLSEELAKAMSTDIPMSIRPGASANAAPPPAAPEPSAASVAPPSRSEPSADETLPVSAGIRAIRPPVGALPFQKKPSSAEIPAAEAPTATPNRSAPTLMGAITPPAAAQAQAQAHSGQRIFSLNQFASLTAEIAVSPERIAETRQRYGVTEAQHKAESQRWTDEFAANTELRQRYFGLVQSYREYLLKQK